MAANTGHQRSPTPLITAMAETLANAAKVAVMPRFRQLAEGEIEEKSPGEPVTVADREAEAMIATGLSAIRPDARFVGEEICAQEPSLLDGLGTGAAWIVDPIDGTGNFAAGRTPFALMAALVEEGALIASAIMEPGEDRIGLAERGAGAWMNGVRLHTADEAPDMARLKGIVSHFMRPEEMAAKLSRLETQIAHVAPTRRCAGHEYPLVARGIYDFALYWRTIVWDHAPGVLFLREAGGVARHLNGADYQPAVAGGPILIARSEAIWNSVAAVLNG